MIFYRILWVIDAIAAFIILYFFVTGLGDGSVSSFNSGLWSGILVALGAILGGSIFLKKEGHLKTANAVLCLLAIPAVFYALFFLIIIFSGAKWN